LILLLSLLFACGGEPPTVASAEPTVKIDNDRVTSRNTPTLLSGARYRLSWDTSGAVRQDDGAWTIDTDLGYRVLLRDGHLATRAVSLVTCTPALQGASSGALGLLHLINLLVPPAFACEGEEDPSTVAGVVEWLMQPAAVELGSASFKAARYCKLHHQNARAHSDSRGLRPDQGMEERTLHLEGSFQRGDAAPVAFSVRSDLAWGELRPLEVEAAQGTGFVEAELSRDLGGLFDGIELKSADEETLARGVLRNLNRGMSLTVRSAAP
jgi:hypothetical protein